MTERGLLVVLSGPSGVGKDTIAKHLAANYPGYVISVSATSRPPRPGEEEGVDYFFVERSDFEDMIAERKFLEHTEYHGNHYGTLRDQVQQKREQGRHVILVIEVEGAHNIRALEPEAVLIFLMPPSWETLRQRLDRRGTETDEAVEGRLAIARRELTFAEQYDFIAVNDSIGECAANLHTIITAATCRTINQTGFVRRILDDAQAIHVPDHR